MCQTIQMTGPVVSPGHNVEVELAGDQSQAGGEEDQGQAQDGAGEDGGVDGSQASTDQPDNEEYWSHQMTSNDHVRLSQLAKLHQTVAQQW